MYKNYIKTFPFALRYLFCASLLTVFIQEIILYDINPFFPKAYELATLLEKILLSFIASIIFYFITQHLPKVEKKIKTSIFINNFAFEMRIVCRDIVRTLYEMRKEDYIDDNVHNDKNEILKRVTRESLRSKVTFSYDNIEYDDWLFLLIRVRSIINETNSVITPYNDVISKEALNNLLNMVQIINIRINPENKINTRTMFSPELFSDLINDLVNSGYKFCEGIQKNK